MLNLIKRIFFNMIGYPITLEAGDNIYKLFDCKQNRENYILLKKRGNGLYKNFGYFAPELKIINNHKLSDNYFIFYLKNKKIFESDTCPDRYAVLEMNIYQNHLEDKISDLILKTHLTWAELYLYWLTQRDYDKIKDFVENTFDATLLIIVSYESLMIKNVHQILTQKMIKKYLNFLKNEYSSKVVKNLLKQLKIKDIRTIFCNLIQREISIRDLPYVVENLANFARFDKDTDILTEKMIQVLK